MSLVGAPTDHVLVDLDCDTLQNRHQGKRCDYLFVGEDTETVWVVPIELKSGRFKASEAAEQLRGGAALTASWLTDGSMFNLVPCWLTGRGFTSKCSRSSAPKESGLRGQERQIETIRCRRPLRVVLRREAA